MRIGYPCINTSIGCTSNSKFKLASYSKDKLISTVDSNLSCLFKILMYNLEKGFFYFRMGSQIVPFASHSVMNVDWKKEFDRKLKEIGKFISENNMRVSMHPDQFVVLNSPDNKIVENSIREIEYHVDLLDAMKLDYSAKVEIHVGGVYADRESARKRFVETYKKLPLKIRRRLVIENDHKLFSLKDCLIIGKETGIPVVFDVFHHECLNNGEAISEAVKSASKTWKRTDGPLIIHYSEQAKGLMKGSHSQHINIERFKRFVEEIDGTECDIMLEIKDKEKSALRVLENMRSFFK